MKKFIRIIAVTLAAIFCLQITAFADGDPNIDHGGSGLGNGREGNFWYSGDEGVRVTVVDSRTGEIILIFN